MTNRQPKGTPVGGQFSEGRKPEGDDLTNIEVDGVTVAGYRHVDIDGNTETLNAGNQCISCGRSSGLVNRVSSERSSEDGIRVAGYMCAECDGCEDGTTLRWCSECGDFTAGDEEGVCHECGSEQDGSVPTDGVDEDSYLARCTQCTGETTFDFEVFAHRLKGDNLMTKVGTTYGEVKIGEWVPAVFPETLMQILRIEHEGPEDYEGWSAQSLAQILKERDLTTAKVTDVLDIFNDGSGDVASVAFDPKRGINQVMLEINGTLERITQ